MLPPANRDDITHNSSRSSSSADAPSLAAKNAATSTIASSSSTHVAPSYALSLTGLWPYYLTPTDAPVLNDIYMCNNMWLLTGANMAGACPACPYVV
jgi:hypothetical protein